MNPILENIIEKRKGTYVHALEVNSLEELTDTIAVLAAEFYGEGFEYRDIIDFFNTIDIYYLRDDEYEEDEIYNFDIEQYLFELL